MREVDYTRRHSSRSQGVGDIFMRAGRSSMGSIAIHGTLHRPVRGSFGAGGVVSVVLLTLFGLVFAHYSLKHIT